MPPLDLRVAAAVAALLFGFACASSGAESSLKLASSAFAPDAAIPREYTCTDADRSPPLAWSGMLAEAKSAALIVDDPDAPGGNWVHWVIYNIPARAGQLAEGMAKTADGPDGAVQGINSFGKIGYNGPCPPPGRAHHYHFRLYALDSMLALHSHARAEDVETATKGHVIASTELVGIFGR